MEPISIETRIGSTRYAFTKSIDGIGSIETKIGTLAALIQSTPESIPTYNGTKLD
jgi:hypothetical protein